MSGTCRLLVSKLLSPHPETRMGCKEGGFEELRQNEWFKEVSFQSICAKELIAP